MSVSNTSFKKIISNDLTITFLLVICAWIFYGIKAGSSPFWYDELFSLYWAQYDNIEDIKKVSNWDVNPPGYPILLHYWIKTFGITEFAVRTLSNICMAISFGLIYFFVKRFFDLRTAIIASILFITNSFLYYYSNEARCYAFILMLSILSNFIFAQLLREPKWYLAILLGTVNYCLYYTHFVIISLFVIQGLFTFLSFKRKVWIWYFSSFIPFFLLLWPFIPRIMEIMFKPLQNNLDKPSSQMALNYLEGYFNNLYFGSFLCVLLVLGIVLYLKKREIDKLRTDLVLWYLVCSGIGFIMLTYAIAVLKSPVFIFRYMIPSYTGVLILFSFFITKISRSWRYFIPLATVIAVVGFISISLNTYKGMNLKRQMEFARSKCAPRTAIFTDNTLAAYYFDRASFHHFPEPIEKLSKFGVYVMHDASYLHGFNYWKYDTVIVVSTWTPTNGHLQPHLTKHYPKVKQMVYKWDGLTTVIYAR